MPDYGHPLRFGSFITPVNQPAAHAVGLSQRSEDLGLDLVTFQDHPYRAELHDTWTLLSWVAATTTRIQVAGNVLNLPMRDPAVLARSVASLDLLSGGRVSLGLGAGWAWDAIEAMGGRRLGLGEGVTALSEAVDVIRGIWDAADRTPLQVTGTYYSVAGAARGPAPAHDVPIWLGAYKPRMLRLTGRKADGWVLGLPMLRPGDLARGNEVIDQAALAVGRAPGDITRLLNVTAADPAAELARLAVRDGVSVFILLSDDPDALRHFAERTVPEIRDRVGEAREQGDRAAPPHRVGVGATRRVPTVGADPVPRSLAAGAVLPGEAGHERYTSSYFRSGAPALVLRPGSPAEVQDAVRFAARHRELPLGLLSGGHGLSGRSLNHGGIVIDLGALHHIEPLGGSRVRIGPGARWGQVARTLAPLGLAITSGDYGGVGVGGLATAGGVGLLVREHGLTIDHLRSIDVVTADGALVHASDEENAELFWAMRGAGANFGVAVSFEFDARPIGEIVVAQLVFAVDDLSAFLQRWGTAVEDADRTVSATLMFGPTPSGQQATVQALVVVDSDDPDLVLTRLQPLAEVAPLVHQSAQLTGYDALLAVPPGGEVQHGRGEPRSHSGLLRHLTPPVTDALTELVSTDAQLVVAIRSAGGAAADVPAEATAYAGRDANFVLVVIGGGAADLARRWEQVVPTLDGLYLSFETDTGSDVLARAFPPAHLTRLRAVKRNWDPNGVFRDNFFIDPDVTDPATASVRDDARP
jgi:alkanesulfonate monooxygenase SsuD/methylene tetrahydromethanopterin reductase-like flavin-dependent oxidoreductase (luciferase family)/FAD/FMN-containing dehydrogenase